MIAVRDVMYYICQLKLHKAAGIDDIVNEHIIFGGSQLAVHVCCLIVC